MNCRKIELFRLPQYSLTRSISGWRKWQRSAGNKSRQACLVVAWYIRDETYSKTLAELVNFADRIRSLGIVWICFFCDSKIGERHTKMCDQTGFAGSIWIAARILSNVPYLILFSIHSGTVTFEKGEIVRRLGSETLHFSNRSTGV